VNERHHDALQDGTDFILPTSSLLCRLRGGSACHVPESARAPPGANRLRHIARFLWRIYAQSSVAQHWRLSSLTWRRNWSHEHDCTTTPSAQDRTVGWNWKVHQTFQRFPVFEVSPKPCARIKMFLGTSVKKALDWVPIQTLTCDSLALVESARH
jgi:hypothetical protein